MKEMSLPSGVQRKRNRRQPLVSIHWDYQNVPNAAIGEKVLNFASSLGYVVTRKIYNNWEASSKTKQLLEELDFECIHVSKCIKNAVDFKLVIDCTCECSSYLSPDIVILICGDGYGEILLDELQPKRKKVIIFARKGSENKNLHELADEFYYVDELPNFVVGNIRFQKASIQPQITYKDATVCLIEVIKTASIQGKRTVLGCIDALMRKHFPNYRGATSILKQDGTTFSSFSKFVDAVVKEGKVRRENQELFLI